MAGAAARERRRARARSGVSRERLPRCPAAPALPGVADEPDQVLRLHQFRIVHPDLIIGPDEFRNWQARIPEPNGETVITRYRLRELIDSLELEELTAEHGPEPDGSPGC